jgi:hypothetical protein
MEDYEFEMPTPCPHCGKTFDLNDGYGSEKWHPDIVICASCYREEEAEIEEDKRWENINIDLSNTLYGLDKEEGIWEKLTEDNRKLIVRFISGSLLSDNQNIEIATKFWDYCYVRHDNSLAIASNAIPLIFDECLKILGK